MIKKMLSYFAMLLIIFTINPLNSMDSISETARKKKKQIAHLSRQTFNAIGEVLAGIPDLLYIAQNNPEIDPFDLMGLPNDLRNEIFTFIVLYNNANSAEEALWAIKSLSLTCTQAYQLIHSPEVFIPMFNNLFEKYTISQYLLAKSMNHTEAMKYYGETLKTPVSKYNFRRHPDAKQ